MAVDDWNKEGVSLREVKVSTRVGDYETVLDVLVLVVGFAFVFLDY